MSTKRCKWCGAYLDPDEWCDCDSQTPPMEDRRPVIVRRKSYEQLMDEYIQRCWDEYDLR